MVIGVWLSSNVPLKAFGIFLDFYGFMKGVEGVQSFHFLIKDRVESKIIVSFRVLATEKTKVVVRSKMNYKLETLPGKFAVDPDAQNSLNKYGAWGDGEPISNSGVDKFPEFCNILGNMSGLVIEMLKNDYFDSGERVEIAGF